MSGVLAERDSIKVYPLRVGNKGTFINYTYLVIDEVSCEALIVDPGWEFESVALRLRETKATLKGVLLTHHHADHSQLASAFATAYNVPVFISEIERDYYNFDCVNIVPIFTDRVFLIGSFRIIPKHTPGHTKGSVCFQIGQFLFTGDTLFIEGCGMCADETAAHEMFKSLQVLKKDIAPSTIIYPGHSYGTEPGVTFNYLFTKNVYCHLNELSSFVAFRLRKNQRGLFDFK